MRISSIASRCRIRTSSAFPIWGLGAHLWHQHFLKRGSNRCRPHDVRFSTSPSPPLVRFLRSVLRPWPPIRPWLGTTPVTRPPSRRLAARLTHALRGTLVRPRIPARRPTPVRRVTRAVRPTPARLRRKVSLRVRATCSVGRIIASVKPKPRFSRPKAVPSCELKAREGTPWAVEPRGTLGTHLRWATRGIRRVSLLKT